MLINTVSAFAGGQVGTSEKRRSSRVPHPFRGCASQPALGGDETVAMTEQVMLQFLLNAYDWMTKAHALRSMFLARSVAHHLRLSREEILQAGMAALLHDIGKSVIPRSILEKPGSLDEAEWQIVRRHPEIGRSMLLQAGGNFAALAPFVVAHHENWDGSGYPFGIAREEIPLVARIIAVVDSYDAMTSYRVYTKSILGVEACAELQRCAGSKYDPHIVAAFLSLFAQDCLQPERPIQNPAADTVVSAGVVYAGLLPRFDECALVSA